MRLLCDASGKLALMLIIVLMVVLLLGVGIMVFTPFGQKLRGTPAEKPVELSSWALDEFVVNLADRGEPRYLKVELTLEVEGKSKGGKQKEPSADEAKVRDAIISILTRQRFGDLLAEAGKTQLKDDLTAAINEALEDSPRVANIYFTSFAMQ